MSTLPIAKMGMFENYIHLVDVNGLTTVCDFFFPEKIIPMYEVSLERENCESLLRSNLKVV